MLPEDLKAQTASEPQLPTDQAIEMFQEDLEVPLETLGRSSRRLKWRLMPRPGEPGRRMDQIDRDGLGRDLWACETPTEWVETVTTSRGLTYRDGPMSAGLAMQLAERGIQQMKQDLQQEMTENERRRTTARNVHATQIGRG